jgi:hypothetical protein
VGRHLLIAIVLTAADALAAFAALNLVSLRSPPAQNAIRRVLTVTPTAFAAGAATYQD